MANIAIDGTIIREEITGTGFYITNLVNGLAKIDAHNQYFILGDRQYLQKFLDLDRDNFHIVHQRFKSRILRVMWQYFLLPLKLRRLGIDILHSPNIITPLYKLKFKIIVTIHDMTFLLFPKKYTIAKRLLFRKMIPVYIRMADRIFACSKNTKTDILKFFKHAETKTVVTYESYPPYYNTRIDAQKAEAVLKEWGIAKDFILFVGMIEPRKNILSLLKAFSDLDRELDADLVIVGKKGWYYEEIEQFLSQRKNRKQKNRILFTGYVPEQQLKYFYRQAMMFAYPSFYEGFGLPPLQAMACGTPVITSATSSLPEVVGDAALTIDPHDVEALKSAIRTLYADPQKRDALVQKGLQNIQRFGPETIASKALAVYNSLK